MLMSCPVVALVAGVKIGSGSWSDSFKPAGSLMPQTVPVAWYSFQPGAGEIAARDALDGKHFGAHHHHGAAAEFVGMLANGRG